METANIQTKIEKLHHTIHTLRHIGDKIGYAYVNDLARLNKEIHDQIDELYPLQGETDEQEADLCLAILLGYSVLICTNSGNEIRKQGALERSQNVLLTLLPTPLSYRLLAACEMYKCNI